MLFLCTTDARAVTNCIRYILCISWGFYLVFFRQAEVLNILCKTRIKCKFVPFHHCLYFMFISAALLVLHLFAVCQRLGIIPIPARNKCTCTPTYYSNVLLDIYNMYITPRQTSASAAVDIQVYILLVSLAG